jgi:hypothetical protein
LDFEGEFMRSLLKFSFAGLVAMLSAEACGQHIDHHNHVIRDSHGHAIGIQHHDVIHSGTHYPTYPSTHIDHHHHVIRDSHGHVTGVHHHDVLHSGPHFPTVIHPSTILSQPTHVDHHDHLIRDSHGHAVGVQHHTVLHSGSHHPGWSYYVPTLPSYSGQYYVEKGHEYYMPASPQGSGVHVVAKPAIVEFGGFARYQDLSGRLETLSNELLVDLHHNYNHNPGFKETYREAYQLLEVAKYVHAADHNRDGAEMREKLAQMDPLFHHLQSDVQGWSRIHSKQVGTLGVAAKLEMIEATLHHLMHDVGVPENAVAAPQPVKSQPLVVEQAPPPSLP